MTRACWEARYRSWQRPLSLGLVGLAGLVPLGWWLSTTLGGGWPQELMTMKPATALCFGLSGIALYSFGNPHAGRRQRRMAQTLAVLVVVLSVLSLLRYAVGTEVLLDNPLVNHPAQGGSGTHWMSGYTALALAALGAGTWHAAAAWKAARAGFPQYAAVAVAGVGFLGLVGHLYNAPLFLTLSPVGTPPVHSAAGLIVAALALLFLHPDGAVMTVFASPGEAGQASRQMILVSLPGLLLFNVLVVSLERRFIVSHEDAAALRNLTIFGVLLMTGWKSFARLDRHGQLLQVALEEKEVEVAYAKELDMVLERRNQDLETLLHVTSHDLKEPLRAIESFGRLLAERHSSQLDAKGSEFLGRLVRASGRMGQLLEDISMLSRARQSASMTEVVPSETVISEVLAQLDASIRETGARVQVGGALVHLPVGRVWATRALYNLVANALKFTHPGQSPDIEIATWKSGDEAGFVVRDRGPGVPLEQADRIFALFQRGVGREVPGTGAGLAIVREVAVQHGGRTWAAPRAGGGAEFVVTFGQRRAA